METSFLDRRSFLKRWGLGAVASVIGAPVRAGQPEGRFETPADYTEADRQIWEEELEGFVPRRIFDAHAHLFQRSHVAADNPGLKTWHDADGELHRQWARRLYPGRDVRYLFLGTPIKGIDVRRHNEFLGVVVARDPRSRANMLVTPDCSPEYIASVVRQQGFVGLKPYRLFSTTGDPDTCRIRDFFTEPQMELANELGLWVTMHVSKNTAVADPENLADLADYTQRRYPRIKWILAHCGRSFSYWVIRQGVDRLRTFPNIFYDLSAVCDLRPFLTLFQKEDPKRIFFGSDGVAPAFYHGAIVAFGRAWTSIDVSQRTLAGGGGILAIYENLLAIKQAAEIAGFGQPEVDGIFWKNAAREFGDF